MPPENSRKPFLMFTGAIEKDQWHKIDELENLSNDIFSVHRFIYKQSIFDPRPENYLSLPKKLPPRIV